MFYLLRNLWVYPLIFLWVLVLFPVMIIVGLFSGKRSFGIYSWLCRRVLKLLSVELVVEVDPEVKSLSGGRIYLGLNQESPLETFLWPASVPGYAKYVLNIEFALVPLIGWGFWAMRHIVIARQWKSSAKKQILKGVDFLRGEGEPAVCMMADGYMKSNGVIGPYKKGGIHMAQDASVAIVPVAIHGAVDLLKREELGVRPGVVTVRLLKPILPLEQGTPDETREMLIQLARREFPGKKIVGNELL